MASLLDGKRCLSTGAASGIGRGIAQRFVAEGARVVAFDLSEEGLGRLRAEIDPGIVTVQGDVRSFADNERAMRAATDAFGGLDVFVGNAGRSAASFLTEQDQATGGRMDAATLAERQARSSPIGVAGQAEDHAPAYVFLASDQASAITGVITVSDGGLHALDPNAGGLNRQKLPAPLPPGDEQEWAS